MIKRYIANSTIVIAQTVTMRDRLISTYGLSNVEIVPNAVALENVNTNRHYSFNLPKEKIKLLYPTSYSSHKNLEILIPLAREILLSKLPYCIVITLDKGQHKCAGDFLGNIEKLGLQNVIHNIGHVGMEKIPSLYTQCDALIMPTLLESYGLPYVEAMYHNKTILTSEIDFAKDVCGDAAYYFDPLDAKSILASIELAFGEEKNRLLKIDIGNEKINKLLTWEQVFGRYHELLEYCKKNIK